MYRPVPPAAREYYGLAALSAVTWRSKGTSVARNLVGYGGGILDGLEEQDVPFCSLTQAFMHAQCLVLGLDHLTPTEAQSVVLGPDKVRVGREGDEMVVSFSTADDTRLTIPLLSTAVSRAATQLNLPSCDAAVLLAAVVGSYAYVWCNRSGSLAPRVGMTIAVRSRVHPGRPVYGTPGCTRTPAAWHPLFARVGIPKTPFRRDVLRSEDCLNPPFSGHHFARCVDAIEHRDDVKWVQLIAPLGWLPGVGVAAQEDELIVTDELTACASITVSSRQLCSFVLSSDKVPGVREALLRTVEGIHEGWGAHLPWRIPVLLVRVSGDKCKCILKDGGGTTTRITEVKAFANPSVLYIQGEALLAHSGSLEPFLITRRASVNALLLAPPGIVVKPLGDSFAISL